MDCYAEKIDFSFTLEDKNENFLAKKENQF